MGNSNYRRTVISTAHQNIFFGLVKITLGLVHANYMWVQLALMSSCKPDFLCTMSRHCDFRHYTIDLIHLIYFVTAVLGLIQAIGRNAS